MKPGDQVVFPLWVYRDGVAHRVQWAGDLLSCWWDRVVVSYRFNGRWRTQSLPHSEVRRAYAPVARLP